MMEEQEEQLVQMVKETDAPHSHHHRNSYGFVPEMTLVMYHGLSY